jgi:hypothetical protein
MANENCEQLYTNETIEVRSSEENQFVGLITEHERLVAAKQILLGLAILFIITVIAYLYSPEDGNVLLEICKTVFPPLATLIIAFYFKDRNTQ